MSLIERAVRKNRTIVSVNLGREWRKFEDPAKVEDFFISECDRAGGRLVREAQRMSRHGHGFGIRHYRREVFDHSRLEEFETCQLEVAFVYGHRDVIDRIVQGEQK